MIDYLTRALVWADSHGLTVPLILAAVTTTARLAWALLRPVVLRRWPSAVPVIEGAALRIAALLPDVLGMLLRRPARVIVVSAGLAASEPERPTTTPPPPSGQSGSATVGALVVLAALGLVVCAMLQGCPRLPPVSGCEPGTQRCSEDRPEVCSATHRWHPVGDLPCSAVGGRCVEGISAHCVPGDGGAP